MAQKSKLSSEDAELVLESAMTIFYDSGFTNTAINMRKLFLNELERFNQCVDDGTTYEKLKPKEKA